MVAPIVAARLGPAIPAVLPVVGSILDAIIREDVMVEQIIKTVHQIGSSNLVIVDIVPGDAAVLGTAHAKAKAAVLAQHITRYAQIA